MDTVGKWIGRYLKQRDIDAMFTLTGGHIFPLFDGAVEAGIRVIDTRHEQAAAFAAEGWALRTGRPGVYAATAGPGFVNAVSGLAHASVTQSRTLCLAGASPVGEDDKGAPQELEQLRVAEVYTRYAKTVRRTDRVPQYFENAFQHMLGPNPGPAFLELPQDVLYRPMSAEAPTSFGPRPTPRSAGDPRDVERAADLLRHAERPAVVVGGGGFWSGAADELRAFAEATGLPVFTRNAGRGLLPDSHPQCYGGSPGLAVFKADVVLVVGSRFSSTFYYGQFAEGGKVIQVDCNAAALGDNRGIDVGICGDAKLVLEQLTAALDGFSTSAEWISTLDGAVAKRVEKFAPGYHSTSTPIHPMRLLHEINEFADERTTITIDGGDIGVAAARHLRAEHPGAQPSNASILGSLGPGLPFALGAKVAAPDDHVICVNGDGAFGIGAMEMDTAVRLDLPFTCVIGNDLKWGMIERAHVDLFGGDRVVAADLGDRPYEEMVRAMGGYGERVEDPDQIRPALDRARDSGLPACLNVIIDPKIRG
ncbi:MAG: thiamine pyrophosphate-binding protein [Deltaproteobacteria bacterium]|nr:thiamine pyrophosphate-binding protein [Deltaproteobacteria bacterium]MBW2414010.1 thiamine pyrophosphate-binding protein [Deltaproteobacteria bacterium]